MKQYCILLFLLIGIIAFSLVGCGDNGDDGSPDDGSSDPVTVETTFISNVTYKDGMSGGTVAGKKIISRGVCWNTTGYPTTNDKKTVDGSGAGYFTSKLTGLEQATDYFYRAYATTSKETYYGDEYSFTTRYYDPFAFGFEGVEMNPDGQTATATITIHTIGDANVTEIGVVYSDINRNPTVTDTKVAGRTSGFVEEELKITVGPLLSGVKYYFAAYVIADGTASYSNTNTLDVP